MDFSFSLPPSEMGRMRSPKVDVGEGKDAYEMSAELPGLDENDIEVPLANGSLVLKGEQRDERDTKEKDYHVTERSYGMFKRTFRIPEGVDKESQRHFKKGLLSIKLPKTAEAKSKQRRISVKSG